MPEFEAVIPAAKLKHMTSVLRRVNDESIFRVSDAGVTSRVVDGANAIMAQVAIAGGGVGYYAPEPHTVGIDLDKMASVLKRAAAKDNISISEFADDTWFITRGIHQRGMQLLNPEKLRKCPDRPKIEHTAAMMLYGKEFKDIVGEAGELGTDWILWEASGEHGLTFRTESNGMTPEPYTGTLPADRFEIRPEDGIKCLFTLGYLQDIADGMRATDEVMVRFDMDMPCEIEYARDGVVVWHMLAPRIESD